MRADTARVLAQVGLNKDPDTPVRHLIVAEKQLVEIAKALARNAKLLIMDEPTASLTSGETEALFKLMAKLTRPASRSSTSRRGGTDTNEVIVMRDGRFVTRQTTKT